MAIIRTLRGVLKSLFLLKINNRMPLKLTPSINIIVRKLPNKLSVNGGIGEILLNSFSSVLKSIR